MCEHVSWTFVFVSMDSLNLHRLYRATDSKNKERQTEKKKTQTLRLSYVRTLGSLATSWRDLFFTVVEFVAHTQSTITIRVPYECHHCRLHRHVFRFFWTTQKSKGTIDRGLNCNIQHQTFHVTMRPHPFSEPQFRQQLLQHYGNRLTDHNWLGRISEINDVRKIHIGRSLCHIDLKHKSSYHVKEIATVSDSIGKSGVS